MRKFYFLNQTICKKKEQQNEKKIIDVQNKQLQIFHSVGEKMFQQIVLESIFIENCLNFASVLAHGNCREKFSSLNGGRQLDGFA